MSVKLKPHHSLTAIKSKFATVGTLEITAKATRDARELGYTLQDIVAVVQALESGDFIKSETARSPLKSKVCHDTYRISYD